MTNNSSNTNIHFEKDRKIATFLLTQDEVKYLGFEKRGSTVYLKFSPREKATVLVDDFYTKRVKSPPQPKELLDKEDDFRDIVSRSISTSRSNFNEGTQ